MNKDDTTAHQTPASQSTATKPGLDLSSDFSAKDIQAYIASLAAERHSEQDRDKQVAADQKHALAKEMLGRKVSEGSIAHVKQLIREAASRGEYEVMVLRFPNELCSDRGRAINNMEEGWTETLSGLPKEAVETWRSHFKPLGFKLTAQVIEFPGGMPGDIGMFLSWHPARGG